MKRRINLSDSIETMSINISPLIDMMFLLLIFFIVTTSFVSEMGIPIQKPTSSSTQWMESGQITLSINSQNQIFLKHQEMNLNQVRSNISRMLNTQQKSVIIVADKNCTSQMLISVLDECRLAGAQIVNVATQDP